MRRQPAALAVLLAAALVSAACGSSPTPAEPSPGQPDKVAAGVIAIVDVAPIYLGVEKGFFTKQSLDVTLQTAQGAILGTFQYMAPEQLEGREADARTDIFAFGATLWEMITGRKAFEGTGQASLRPLRRSSVRNGAAD